ncbi:hypothetical protein VI817_009794 [Penicillium citrinum]|uniref:NAD dependent epimerase/dehydratase n=1 Tax=Penicillium hetheringtonii TaxID=911720 RepID=A0AAD6GRC8_9EURO|nr:NAD dependent epimerase/dehydratase [Penicillium hetheringtonii]KAK5788836.1 hypothetical protein VI817_009794 [Penicillium citrinum]
MDPSQYALPRGSRILVTGANGYISTHVVDQLLGLGYSVRGTLRTEKPWLNEYFLNKYGKGRFETVVISLQNKDEVDRALDGVDGLIHLATDLSFSSDPNAVIPWVAQAAKDILEIASRKSSIKRVVLASSSTAAYMTWPEPNGRQIDTNSWNDAGVAAAWDESTPEQKKPMTVYAASKTEAERQAWKWVEEKNPGFVLNSVLPCFNVGKVIFPEAQGSTMGFVRALLKGDASSFNLPEQWYVDVEDVARLFVVGLLDPNVKSERIFAFGEQTHWQDVVSILRKLRPDNKDIPDVPADIPRDRTTVVPRERAVSLLKGFYDQAGFTPIKKSLAEGIEDLK